MESNEKIKANIQDAEQSITLIVQGLKKTQNTGELNLNNLPFELSQRIKSFALKEMTEDLRDYNYAKAEMEKEIAVIS